MKSYLSFCAAAYERPRVRAFARAALTAYLALIAASVSHAVTVYLPPCDGCALNSGPPVGDEWVVQGTAVQATGSFNINGTLTNHASVLDNLANIDVYGKLINTGQLVNTGTIHVYGGYDFTAGTLVNRNFGVLKFETPFIFGAPKSGNVVLGAGGEMQASQLTNRAGHVQVNSGMLSMGYGPFANEKGATFVNNGNFITGGGVTQAGTWIGSGSYEQPEGSLNLTGVMVQDSVKFIHGGLMTISKGGVLSANQLSTGFAAVELDGGTINSPNEAFIPDLMKVHGDGGVINANVYLGSVQLNDAKLVVNGNAVLESLEQTGDSAVSSFRNLTTTQYGRIKASGNILVFGDFINHSTSVNWSTTGASLTLLGQGKHEMALAGQDRGASGAGFAASNFAWKDVVFGEGGEWLLTDGNDTVGAALYARHLSFLGGLDQIKALSGDYNIYYDPTAVGNEMLEGKTYAFGNGTGKVIAISAVPEPDAFALCLAGVGAVVGWRRRRLHGEPVIRAV